MIKKRCYPPHAPNGFRVFQMYVSGCTWDEVRRLCWDEGFKDFAKKTWDKEFKVIGMKGSKTFA